MAFDTGISSAVAQYVYTQSNGNVTEPIGGSYIQAYCEYLGITEPLYNSWLIALCNHFGITQPLNGSWTIALANYYGITYPTGGTWWMALAFAGTPGPTPTPPATDFIWNLDTILWNLETRLWNSAGPTPTPTPPTPTPTPMPLETNWYAEGISEHVAYNENAGLSVWFTSGFDTKFK